MDRTVLESGAAAFGALSDDDLVEHVKDLAVRERRASVALIRSLVEFDIRHLYLREGCSSLFTYCTQVLHLSEGSAYNRIETARAARRYPEVLEALERGELTITSVRLLAPHLTDANHAEVLVAARHKGKQAIQELVAVLSPRPAVATVIRPLAPLPSTVEWTPTVGPLAEPPAAMAADGPDSPSMSDARGERPKMMARVSCPLVTPLAPERYRLHVTLSRETHEKLRRAQALARHAVSDGDLDAVLDRALTLLIDDIERRKWARTATPRPRRTERPARGRHIPAAVRRTVWDRDEGRCTFVGAAGRCREIAFLEFHHVDPYAAGGAATVDNIQLRCRAHNQYESRVFFGSSP